MRTLMGRWGFKGLDLAHDLLTRFKILDPERTVIEFNSRWMAGMGAADVIRLAEQILKAEGIISSETLIAFRTFSQYDLERMFAIGMD